jgi:glycosyltransferase involved in cell wall biosynthesis
MFEILSNYKKLIVVGPFPPPIGGVSVHLARFCDTLIFNGTIFKLDTTSGIKLFLLTYIKLLWISLFGKSCAVYVNSTNLVVLLLLIFFRGDFFFRVHNDRLCNLNFSHRFILFVFFFFKINFFFVANDDIKKSISKHYCLPEGNILISSAYLSPPLEKADIMLESFPQDLFLFLSRGGIYFSVSAYKLSFHNSQDLYGIDLCISMLFQLRRAGFNVKLIIVIANPESDLEYFQKLKQMVIDFELGDEVYFLCGQIECWPIYKIVQIYLRTTNTDSEGISIKEALSCGCSVIASDVCVRPPGVTVFESRNLNDLVVKSVDVINTM